MSEPTVRPIHLVHRGRAVSVQGVAPTLSLLEWLREQRCTGTKEGCAEGDCGACTVIVAEPVDPALPPGAGDTVVDGLRLRTVNACMQFMPALDGKAVITVEDLAPTEASPLHPAQRAMVQCHGSQCGFCTPGFVMSLTACHERHAQAGSRPTRPELADALSGNLCRCTGYRPILDAGLQMFEGEQRRLALQPVAEALRGLSRDEALHYAGPPASGQQPPQSFDAPRTVEALAALRLAKPQARLLAGGTDIGLWVTKQFRDLGDIIYLGNVAALQRIEPVTLDGQPGLRIGAAVTLETAWTALAEAVPALREVWLRFASPPIRHAGTLAGNVANGSPIGDGAPVLMALGCTLVLRRGTQQRRMNLEAFYLDYMKNALQPGEFIEALEVRLPSASTQLRVWKLSKRHDSDISAVCAALALVLSPDGRVGDVRLAFGGMAATVKRAAQAEAALRGQPWNEAAADAAAQALAQDFKPLTDLRASAAYRLKASQHLLRRLWLETRAQSPLSAEQTQVWAHAAHRAARTPTQTPRPAPTPTAGGAR